MTETKKTELTVREYDWQRDDLARFITAYNGQYTAGPDPKRRKQTS